MSNSKWLADKALAQLRNTPRIDLNNVYHVGTKPVRFFRRSFRIYRGPAYRAARHRIIFISNKCPKDLEKPPRESSEGVLCSAEIL